MTHLMHDAPAARVRSEEHPAVPAVTCRECQYELARERVRHNAVKRQLAAAQVQLDKARQVLLTAAGKLKAAHRECNPSGTGS